MSDLIYKMEQDLKVHELNQNIFNKVYVHLLKQGERAENDIYCKYRTKDGLKCAVGCLITNDYYSKELEGQGVSTPDVRKAVAKSLDLSEDLPYLTLQLLQDLQSIHDDILPTYWERDLRNRAREYGLSIPEEVK